MKNNSIVDTQAYNKKENRKNNCPVHATIAALSGKWKMQILWELRNEAKRFGQLQESIAGITPAVLSAQLQTLTQEGILHRELYPAVPPKVEYSLTGAGQSLIAVIVAMEKWGIQQLAHAQLPYDNSCLWDGAG
ncbi:winged helix-turn-helix transcriptional regulator [Deminuibacter soli]|uniref:Transcriptional regulator n=1 Tax=Deminuibacter soli TaxID=2291815 RepID=A0A3E1NHC2_9BACT|nr:helix-turn-helix domain-containing protein [Deminuibacter soli]RFM27343.1 transcriptional regulator [Deminuibacter soli]